jgi:hypothetical protein
MTGDDRDMSRTSRRREHPLRLQPKPGSAEELRMWAEFLAADEQAAAERAISELMFERLTSTLH